MERRYSDNHFRLVVIMLIVCGQQQHEADVPSSLECQESQSSFLGLVFNNVEALGDLLFL